MIVAIAIGFIEAPFPLDWALFSRGNATRRQFGDGLGSRGVTRRIGASRATTRTRAARLRRGRGPSAVRA